MIYCNQKAKIQVKGDDKMHSYQGEKNVFHYDGDFSGEIIITEKMDDNEWVRRQREGISIPQIEVPAKIILEFVSKNRFHINGEILLFDGITSFKNYDFHVDLNRIVVIVSVANRTSIKVMAKELVEFVCYRYVYHELIDRVEAMSLDELAQKLPELLLSESS